MFRMWGKLWKDNHLVRDTVINISDYSLSRTQMVFQSLEEICYQFDLSQPIWLDANIREFVNHFGKEELRNVAKLHFANFDYLELQVIEE